jgi:hypothetical protein
MYGTTWNSVVGIATGYGLDGQGVGVRVPVGARFPPLHVLQSGSGAHQVPGAPSPGVK